VSKKQEGAAHNMAYSSTAVVQGSTLNNSVVIQVINSMQSPADIDQAISQISRHLNILRRKKGLIDARLPLGLIAAVCATAGILLGGRMLWLLVGTLTAVFASYLLAPALNKVDTEITAAQNFLTELYKIRLARQLQDAQKEAA